MVGAIGRVVAVPVAGLGLAVALAGCGSSAGAPNPVAGDTQPPTSGAALLGTCASTFGQVQSNNGPVSPAPTGPQSLGVPAGPHAALVCEYGPLTAGTPAGLAWTRTLGTAQAADLLAVVNTKITRGDQLGVTMCPKDNGSAAVLRFSYPTGPTHQVVVRLTGCQPAASDSGTTMFRQDIVRAVLALAPSS